MARWLFWAPVVVLTLLGALWAFRAGWIAVTLTETDVINAQVARYLQAVPNGRPEDCHAEPMAGAWLIVLCAPRDGPVWQVRVDRWGRVVPAPAEGV